MQVPTSVDRAVAMASVTGGPGLPVSLTEDYESKQALSIAQSTVASLRERLAQKEETLERSYIKGSRSHNRTNYNLDIFIVLDQFVFDYLGMKNF